MPKSATKKTNHRPRIATASLEEVLGAYRDLRAATADLFHAVGVDATRTRETARELGLNRGLAWRLSRVVREADSAVAISDVPGRPSIEKLIAACRERGAPESELQATMHAFDAYQQAVDACSGDRKTLAMMMANHGHVEPSAEQERARRKLFEGACSVWGGQAQVRFVTVFVFPSADDPTQLDAGHVTGFVGFRRLSPRPWPLSYEAVHDDSGTKVSFQKVPLDPNGVGEGELQLLSEFCDPPRPKIDVCQNGDFKRFDLAAGPVGNEGLTTCVFGSHLRQLYPRYSEAVNTAGFMVLLTTPVELVVFDMFVHRDLGIEGPPRSQLLDRLKFPHSNDESLFDEQSLPIAEEASMIRGGVRAAMHLRIPWYGRLLEYVGARIGHNLDEFDGSRFEMAYPPISTTLSRRFDLAKPPK